MNVKRHQSLNDCLNLNEEMMKNNKQVQVKLYLRVACKIS